MTKEKINNTQLLKETGLRVRHFHTVDRFGFPRQRSMTIAYKEGQSNVEIATAVVHPVDTFSRKMGTKLAVESFIAGKTVRIPKAIDFNKGPTSTGRFSLASACHTLGILFG